MCREFLNGIKAIERDKKIGEEIDNLYQGSYIP